MVVLLSVLESQSEVKAIKVNSIEDDITTFCYEGVEYIFIKVGSVGGLSVVYRNNGFSDNGYVKYCKMDWV